MLATPAGISAALLLLLLLQVSVRRTPSLGVTPANLLDKWSRLPGRLASTQSVGAERPGSVEDLADLGPARQPAATLNEGGIDRVAKPGARNDSCPRADSVHRAHGSPRRRSEGVLCVQQDTAGL